MLYISENFLPEEQCLELIKFYEDNVSNTFKHGDTFPLSLSKFNNSLTDEIDSKVENICAKLFPNEKIRMDNHEIVKWPEGAFQDAHYDGDDVCAVIIYLNDDFNGGKTCFNLYDVIKIKPETGKCLIFSNSKYLHWVEKVQTNVRYTLAYWYVRS